MRTPVPRQYARTVLRLYTRTHHTTHIHNSQSYVTMCFWLSVNCKNVLLIFADFFLLALEKNYYARTTPVRHYIKY